MMPPAKIAELGEAMAEAVAAAIKADPNDNLAVHRALWDARARRIADLEAALSDALDYIDKPSDVPGPTLIVLAGRKLLKSSQP